MTYDLYDIMTFLHFIYPKTKRDADMILGQTEKVIPLKANWKILENVKEVFLNVLLIGLREKVISHIILLTIYRILVFVHVSVFSLFV